MSLRAQRGNPVATAPPLAESGRIPPLLSGRVNPDDNNRMTLYRACSSLRLNGLGGIMNLGAFQRHALALPTNVTPPLE